MRPFLLLFLLSSVANAQAVRPPPATGPLIIQQPPSFPASPAATPAGAGASHGSLAAPEKAVPRSPNKRLLPRTKEAGLWAADGAPQASLPRHALWGVDIPPMRNDEGRVVAGETEWCMKGLAKAADAAGWRERIENYSAEVRACMAATAYLRCADERHRWITQPATPGSTVVGASIESARATLLHARSLREATCRGVMLSDEQKSALSAITAAWNVAFEREQ